MVTVLRYAVNNLAGTAHSDGVTIADVFFSDAEAAQVVGAGLQALLNQLTAFANAAFPGLGTALSAIGHSLLAPVDKANSLLVDASTAAARYLPRDVALQVISALQSDEAYWQDALMDALVFYGISPDDYGIAWRNAIALFGVDTAQRHRLADAVYKLAQAKGAPQWAAACVAALVANHSKAWDASHNYLALAWGVPGKPQNIDQAWQYRVDQLKGSLGSLGGTSQGSGGRALLVLLGLLGGGYLLSEA